MGACAFLNTYSRVRTPSTWGTFQVLGISNAPFSINFEYLACSLGAFSVYLGSGSTVILSQQVSNAFQLYDIKLNQLFNVSLSGFSQTYIGYVAVYGQGAPCRGFCRHIFSESHYPKLLIATCWHSECGGFIDSRHVIYVTYM